MANSFSSKMLDISKLSSQISDFDEKESLTPVVNQTLKDDDSIAVGKALFLLLNATTKAFESAVESAATIQSPLRRALESVETYIVNSKTAEMHDMRLQAVMQIYLPVKDNLLKRLHEFSAKGPSSALLLIQYLLAKPPHHDVLMEIFTQELKGRDRKAKLGTIQLLKILIRPVRKTQSLKQNARLKGQSSGLEIFEQGIGLQPFDVALLLPLLTDCIRIDSTQSSSGRKSPTRLTDAATELFLSLSHQLVSSVLTSNPSLNSSSKNLELITDLDGVEPGEENSGLLYLVWNCISALKMTVQEILEWRREQHPLLEVTLQEILNFLSSIEKRKQTLRSPDNVTIIQLCYNWVAWSNGLSSQNYELSLAKFRKRIKEALTEIDDTPYHSYRQLVLIALLLGHRNPSLSIIDILQNPTTNNDAEKKDDDIIGKLHDLIFSFIDSSQIHGQTLAAFLLRRLLISSLTREQDTDPDSTHPSSDSSHPYDLHSLLQPLLSLLDSNEELPGPILGIIAECAVTFPSEVLGSIFLKLRNDNTTSRKISLTVLQEIVRINSGIFLNGTMDTKMSEFIDLLEGYLLESFHDEDIQLRTIASWLFTNLDSARIIPKLSYRLVDRDARVRSAAELALVNTLLDRTGVDGVLDFIEFIRNVQVNSIFAESPSNPMVNAPINPGEILKSNYNIPSHDNVSDTALHIDRLFRIVAKWAEKASPQSWSLLTPRLVKKTYASPSDQILIKCWSIISLHLSKSHSSVQLAIEECLHIMETQSSLTEELANGEGDILQELLFARLCPLLILKTMPSKSLDEILILPQEYILNAKFETENECFDDQTSINGSRMLRQITLRCDYPIEFPQVRYLALSILPHLFFHIFLPYIHQKLLANISQAPQESDSPRGLVYAFASWVLEISHRSGDGISPSHWDEIGEKDVYSIGRIVEKQLIPLFGWESKQASTIEEIQKIHLGVIDTISLILTTAARTSLFKPNAPIRPLIEEIDDLKSGHFISMTLNHPITILFSELLAYVLSCLHPPSAIVQESPSSFITFNRDISDPQLSTCMANILIMTTKRLGGQHNEGGSRTASNQVEANIDMELFAAFVESIGDRIIDVTNRILVEENETMSDKLKWGNLAAACFQVLFQIAYTYHRYEPKRIQRSFFSDLIDTSVNGFCSYNLGTCIGALKLLTILLSMTVTSTSPLNFVDILTPLKIVKIKSGLERLQSAGAQDGNGITSEVAILTENILQILKQ